MWPATVTSSDHRDLGKTEKQKEQAPTCSQKSRDESE
jgi:hypothetical protein